MRHKQGDMLAYAAAADPTKERFYITTNSVIKNNGALVMGRGIALQVREAFKGFDLAAGELIQKACGTMGTYALLPHTSQLNSYNLPFGLFQVKHHYADTAKPDLIKLAAQFLEITARQHPEITFNVNYPGIGNGKLAITDVEPIIRHLPDNVTFWTLS